MKILIQNGKEVDDKLDKSDRELDVDAAYEFFDRACVTPTPDAVDQLVDVFLPCLRIMCERGYDRTGASWKEQGWRGQLFEVMKRNRRLEFWWRFRQRLHRDSVFDAINYCGFLVRAEAENPDKPWGEFDEPDSDEERQYLPPREEEWTPPAEP